MGGMRELQARAQPDFVLPALYSRLHFHSSTVWTPTASSPTASSGMLHDTWMGTMLRCHIGAMVVSPGLGVGGWHFLRERGPSSDPSVSPASGSAPGLVLSPA